jgi:hypothetical protein
MSPIMVGGDGSVSWKVHAERVRSTKTASVGRVHDQEGIDDTEEKGFFTVTIKQPSNNDDREKFLAQLNRFIADPKGELIVRLPIEDTAYLKAATRADNITGGVHDQIKIDWPK